MGNARFPVQFTDVVVTTIKPLHKTAHVETIEPTFMDMFSEDSYVPTMFLYKLADKSNDTYSKLLKRLQESLQKVLIPFFSFAGRWVAAPKGSGSRRKLICNDEGVPFIEAYVDRDLDSVVMAPTEFQPVPELNGFHVLGFDVSQSKQQLLPDGNPSIFVQITRFKCGGVAFVVTFNHNLVDAKGFFNFMTAWSDISRTNETAMRVDHNRAQVEVPSLKALLIGDDERDEASASTNGVENGSKMGTWDMKCFEVSTSTIQFIKQEAKVRQEGQGYVSTGDCIVAHVLKSVAELPSEVLGGKEAGALMAVEGRTRFYDPPLPDLCGNVLTATLTPTIPTSDLLEMPLVSIASRIRDALEDTHWTGVDKFGSLIKAHQAFASGKSAVMATSNWSKFPLYEIDFGCGQPYFVVALNSFFILTPAFIGMAYIVPPVPGNSTSIASVQVSCTPDLLKALERNPQFLSFFS